MRKCINCVWEGKDHLVTRGFKHCPVCGDNTECIGEDKPKPEPKKLSSLDLNKDGKVDMKDVKVAASVLRKVGARLKKGKRGKK